MRKAPVSFVFELEVDVWLVLCLKIYYKSSIPFVCERNEKFLMFSIDFIFTCDFCLIEIYGALGVRSKGICMSEKSSGFVCFWS